MVRERKPPVRYEPEDWRLRKKAKRVTMDLSSVVPYADVASQLEETLSHVNITEYDPAVILDWNLDALQEFVARAIVIDGAPNPPARPGWLRTFPPTAASLTHDIVTHLAQVAGGRFGIVVLAPNNMIQYVNIFEQIRDLEVEPFMQANFAAAPPNQHLARTGFLVDNRRVLQPEDQERTPPPPPLRQIFA
ncbi:hypothetical protein DVH05_020386 [Phytophthora capsici]|nr:hypothetical protein DVH05_020386 [Phytophthora capsici]